MKFRDSIGHVTNKLRNFKRNDSFFILRSFLRQLIWSGFVKKRKKKTEIQSIRSEAANAKYSRRNISHLDWGGISLSTLLRIFRIVSGRIAAFMITAIRRYRKIGALGLCESIGTLSWKSERR